MPFFLLMEKPQQNQQQKQKIEVPSACLRRLALLQGTAFAYIPSIQVFMMLPEYKCTASEVDFVPMEDYENKLTIIQGCLIASSLIPIVIGLTGIVGVLTKFIGPITVSPLMLLLVLSSVDLCVERISKHWVAVM
ncbi:unnamed protein product [Anisakis simplex]|uniref:Aa_trans domain-containing protein n=1 Tax=Anisakis simplex TaxID=6269 RepID=A0A0M3JD53_ANISI|nr:unnamed protein product [Anisakis simplex]